MASTVSARLDRLPLSRVHHRLLVIGGLGYTFDGMDAAIVAAGVLVTLLFAVPTRGRALEEINQRPASAARS